MLFLVPDSDQPPASESGPDSTSRSKEQDGFAVSEDQQANLKVELDLDDAPFLSEPDEEEEPAEEESTAIEDEEDLSLDAEEDAPKGLFANKKKLILLAAALLLILGGAAGAFFFFFGGEGAEPEPIEKKRVVVITTPQEAENVPLQAVELKPFIVPSKGSEGEVRLLHCTLNIPFDDPVQGQEMNVRLLEIRNAIYYYLVNKPLSHLSSEEEATLLKQDLVNVVNELLTVKKITDIYIQEYVVTAP